MLIKKVSPGYSRTRRIAQKLRMVTGRAHFEKGDLDEAELRYDKAEAIFVERFGVRTHFMAHLQYARGNLEVQRKNRDNGRKCYEQSQDILSEDISTRYHILRSANYYKIACLQIEEGKLDDALESLKQGYQIAQLRGAIGEEARIIRKQAHAYSLCNEEEQRSKCEGHQQLARLMRARYPGRHTSPAVELEDGDEEWNKLVCGYYRWKVAILLGIAVAETCL